LYSISLLFVLRPLNSTLFPYTTLFRSMIYKKAEAVGINYLDCPVSGGPTGAEAGTLTILVGGNQEIFPQAESILKNVGEKIVYVDRKSTRLNSSHVSISYAVFCLKKKN